MKLNCYFFFSNKSFSILLIFFIFSRATRKVRTFLKFEPRALGSIAFGGSNGSNRSNLKKLEL